MAADSVLVEIRPRIKSCNASIKLTNGAPAKVIVEKDCFIVGDETYKINGACFDTASVRNLQSDNDFVSFNVKLLNFEGTPRGKWSQSLPILPDVRMKMSCMCSEILLPKVVFPRVLPLPSSHWEVADVFCHGHSVKPGPAAFRPGDCLYSTHYFHISDNLLRDCRCTRCGNIFGKKFRGFFQIWMSDIYLENLDVGIESHADNLQLLYAIVDDVVSDPLAIFSKILLESEGGPFIAIVVLEKDLQVFRYFKGKLTRETELIQDTARRDDPFKGAVAETELSSQFHEITLTNSSKTNGQLANGSMKDELTEIQESKTEKVDEIQTNCKIQEADCSYHQLFPERMLKVEFSIFPAKNQTVADWKKDTSVHCIEVSQVFISDISSLLAKEHKLMHPNFDKIEDRLLSYIPYPF